MNIKTIQGMVRINLKQSKTPYLVCGILVALGIASAIVNLTLWDEAGNSVFAVGNYLFILPLLMPILIPAKHFTRLMNLGAKRIDFFKACGCTYLTIALSLSLICITLRYTLDTFILTFLDGTLPRVLATLNLFDAFGFIAHGPLVAFFQMSAFLLLLCCFLHTLTLAQNYWYGWVADVLSVVIISVFTPIAPLRAALVWFFRMIIFHDYAIAQILSCVVLGAAVYCVSLIPIKSRAV